MYADLLVSDGSTGSPMPGFMGNFAIAKGSKTSPDALSSLQDSCPPRESSSCGECTCNNNNYGFMCFSCDSGDDDDDTYHATAASEDTDDAGATETLEKHAIEAATVRLAASECFICDGFSASTCSLALTSVIQGLDEKTRLGTLKELLDAPCDAAGLSDTQCLGALDASFAQLKTPAKLGLVADMCNLVESGMSESKTAKDAKSTSESASSSAAVAGSSGAEDAAGKESLSHFEMKMAGKKAHQQASSSSSTNAAADSLATSTAAFPSKASASASQQDAPAASAAAHLSVDECSLCAGFSGKTCAAALSNVVAGLDAPSRLDVQYALFASNSEVMSSPSCAAIARASSAGEDAATCLLELDASFASLQTKTKAALASNMCALLEAQASPAGFSSSSHKGSLLSSRAAAASRELTTDDEAAAAGAHSANTRAALLGGLAGYSSKTTTVSKPTVFSAASITNAQHLHSASSSTSASPLSSSSSSSTAVPRESALSMELNAFAQQVESEPTCAVCDLSGSKTQCLGALDAALRGLSDRQRLEVLWRALPRATVEIACPAGATSDEACLENLDAQLAALKSSRRLELLQGACEMGAYGLTAAQLAGAAMLAASPSYAGVAVADLNVPHLMTLASSSSSSTKAASSAVAMGAFSAANALSAALAAIEASGYLKSSGHWSVREAVQSASTSYDGWHGTVGGLAAVALPAIANPRPAVQDKHTESSRGGYAQVASPPANPADDASFLSQGWLGLHAATAAATAGFASGAHALVFNFAAASSSEEDPQTRGLASNTESSSLETSTHSPLDSASKYDDLFMAMGHSAAGFVVGALAAAGVAYAFLVVRRRFKNGSASKQYSEVPEQPPAKWDEKLYESPAFVLSL